LLIEVGRFGSWVKRLQGLEFRLGGASFTGVLIIGKMEVKIVRKLLELFAILVFAVTGHASYVAAQVTFDLSTSILGSTPASDINSPPWLTATFADGAAGHVTLTMTNRMSGPQYIETVAFNSLVDATGLTFNRIDSTPPTASSVLSNSNRILPIVGVLGNAGLFNIVIDFASSPVNQRFTEANGSVVFDIVGGAGLHAENFLQGSFNLLGPSYYMVADVGGLGQVLPILGAIGLGSIATAPIPEPEIYAMLLAGLGLMGFVARRRHQGSAA